MRGFGPGTVVLSDPPVGAPSAPQNVALAWDADSSAYRLTWSAPASNGGQDLSRYDVGHWPAGEAPSGSGTDVGLVLATDVVAATTDDHAVRACNASGCGEWSPVVAPLPGQVTGLGIEDRVDGITHSTRLTWTAPSGPTNAASYRIERSDDGGATFAVLTDAEPGLAHVDATVAAGATYTYRVTARTATADGRPLVAPPTVIGHAQTLSSSALSVNVVEGSSINFDAILGLASTSDVDVSVVSDAPGVALPGAPTVTIGAGLTSTSVTVNAPQDADVAGETATLTLSFAGLTRTVGVTVIDDDVVAVLAPAELTVAKDASVPLEVSLDHQPSGPVTVAVSSTSKASVGPATLTFTPANWSVPQTVTVTGESPGSATVTLDADDPAAVDATVDVTVN